MEIIEIKQLDNGVQKKPYADHIYHWQIRASYVTDEAEMLAFCQQYLKKAKTEQGEYMKQYRSRNGFNALMELVCGGWYSLTLDNDRTWNYIVHYEYID